MLSQTQALVDRLTREGLVSLAEAARKLGHAQEKRRPTAKLLRRWCVRGKGGTTLEHLIVGGRFRTSWRAVQRFLAATQPERPCELPAARSGGSAERRRLERAHAEMVRLGLSKPRATASAARPA